MDLARVRQVDLWYVVGVIASDGCLSRDGRHVNITSRHRLYLRRIREILSIKNTIGRKWGANKSRAYHIQIGSVAFVRFLTEVGLTPRKSLTIGALKIPDEYFVDFLRGVIDGDGNIRSWVHPGNGCRQWALRIYTASGAFAGWLKDCIEQRFRVKGVLHQARAGRLHPLYIIKFGKLAMRIILRGCYYPEAFSLLRKQRLAIRCIRCKSRQSYGDVIEVNSQCII